MATTTTRRSVKSILKDIDATISTYNWSWPRKATGS